MYLNRDLKVKQHIDTQEEENSYPSRKNSISRGRKVGQHHVYLDNLRTKLPIQEGFSGVAKVKFGQIWQGYFYKGSRMSSGEI